MPSFSQGSPMNSCFFNVPLTRSHAFSCSLLLKQSHTLHHYDLHTFRFSQLCYITAAHCAKFTQACRNSHKIPDAELHLC